MMLFEKQNQNENIQPETLGEDVKDVGAENEASEPHPERSAHRWHNDTLKRIDEEHKVHAESEIDHDLLLALGYVDGEKDRQRPDVKGSAEQTMFSESVYGMKKEYHDVREIPYIKQQFHKDARSLNLRLLGTAISVFLLLIYPVISTMLKGKVEFFDAERFFGANLLICVDLMLIAAAFSVIPLLRGLRGMFTMKPTLYSPSAMLILVQTAISLAYAFLIKGSTPAHMSLYCLPAAISLIFPILSEKMQLDRQYSAFLALTDHEETGRTHWALTKDENGAVLVKNAFPEELVKQTGTPYTNAKLMNLALIPLSALCAVVGLLMFFITKNVTEALSVSALCFCLSLAPLTAIFGYASFYISTKDMLDPSETVLVGRSSVDALADIDCITVSEKEIFGSGSADTLNMELYNDANLFDLLYFTASALKGRDLPFSHIFTASAEDIELSDSCTVTESTNDGFCTLVDGDRPVHIGNAEYLRRHGMDIPYAELEDTEDGHAAPLFIALDGKPISYFCIDYNPCEEFVSFTQIAASEGVKIRILSSDFCVTNELIRAKLNIEDDAFELVKSEDTAHPHACPLFTVASERPEPLSQVIGVCRSVKKVEKLSATTCTATVILSILLSALSVVFKLFFLSPYIVLALSSVLTVIPALLTKGYVSGNT